MFRICPACGKHRGGNTDHTECSKRLQRKRQLHETKINAPANARFISDYKFPMDD